MSLFNELKRRNVLRVGVAYSVSAWLVIQVVATIFPSFGFGDAAIRVVTILFAIGIIPTLVFAWVFELTPDGLKKEEDVDHSQAFSLRSAKTLDRMIMIVLTLAVGYFAVDKFVLDPARDDTLAEAARQEGRQDALLEVSGDRSIAVLPFENMSSDPEQEFFADGITEEVLNILAKVPSLRVTARTSSFFFKGRETPLATIAETLNVRHILEGSVRKSGNRVRITAQLIDAQTNSHLWSETYDRELLDVFQIQDEVASTIAMSLAESFVSLDSNPAARSDSVAAFEAYRTGRLRWWRRSPKELHKAIELFKQAIEYDPGFAPAYAAIADSWLLLVRYGDVHYVNGIDSAKPMIEKALSIDADSAEAIAAQGLSDYILGETEAAEISLKKAISLDENYIPPRVWLSVLLGDIGRIPEQGAVLQEAISKDPLNEILTINYSVNQQARGDYTGAKNTLASLLRLQPGSILMLTTMSGLASESGELVEAWKYAKQAYDIQPDSVAAINRFASAWIDLGEYEEAGGVLLNGMEVAKGNVDVEHEYVTLMLIENRADEAERRIYDLFGDTSSLPAKIQRLSHFNLALLAGVRQDVPLVLENLKLALDPSESQLLNNNKFFVLTMLSALHTRFGDPELGEQYLQTAERVVGHARLNGIDDGDIYYLVSCLFALRGEKERAIQSLQQASEKGWHRYWLFENDIRFSSIENEPKYMAILKNLADARQVARSEVQSIRSAHDQ